MLLLIRFFYFLPVTITTSILVTTGKAEIVIGEITLK